MNNWTTTEIFQVFDAIFSNKKEVELKGKKFHRTMFAKGALKGFRINQISIIEQNPAKGSTYAARARAGEKLAWLIPPGTGRWWLIEQNKITDHKGKTHSRTPPTTSTT